MVFPISFVVVGARTGNGVTLQWKDGYARRKIRIKTLIGRNLGAAWALFNPKREPTKRSNQLPWLIKSYRLE